MGSVHSLEQILADSSAMADVAERAGVTLAQACAVAAALADRPIADVVRICTGAYEVRAQQQQRAQRKRG